VLLAAQPDCVIEQLTRYRDDSKKLVGLEIVYKGGKTVVLGKRTSNAGIS